ncbi:unnamed protein product [Chrysoparadoxa australica]
MQLKKLVFISAVASCSAFSPRILGRTHAQPAPRSCELNLFSALGFGGNMAGSKEMPEGFQDTAKGWDELETMLYQQMSDKTKEMQALQAKGDGPASASANLRLFGAPQGTDPRVVLYRDDASWCPYCEKVWLQLEVKKIPYRVERTPMSCYGSKPRSFLTINRSGAIPVAIIDGVVIKESNDIMMTLEETFPDHNPLLPPPGSLERDVASTLLRLERQLFSQWFRWLTSYGTEAANRSQQGAFEETMDRVNQALEDQGGPYFMGKDISLVDCMYAPFLERMAASLPYYKGLKVEGNERWPAVNRWFEEMFTREDFGAIRSDYYTHVHDLPPQVGGCTSTDSSKPYADEIDGTDGSWALPLKQGIEPIGPKSETEAKLEAAQRLISNHEAVVAFSLRGLAGPGSPRVSAPYSDPYAMAEETFEPAVDAALRHITQALLTCPEATQEAGLSVNQPSEEVVKSLSYLGRRIGVPRDMSFAGARQLRGHLEWYKGIMTAQ